MHYVPDSARELLQGQADDGSSLPADEQGFHYRSAPIYVLTAIVGLLLAADLVLAFIGGEWAENFRFIGGQQLATIAAVFGGARILYQTIDSALAGRIGTGLALSIATLAAIVLGENVTAALVVFIALCGESIEGYTVDRAQRAIRNIFRLRPTTARLLRDGKEYEVRVEEIAVGNQLIIKPGERIPVDGQIVTGSTTIDQSALTGESFPVDATTDDPVFAGTLNQFGSITVAAQKVGEETSLAQVIRLVAEAADQKSTIERTADRLARIFLPVVLGVAGITLLVWRFQTGVWQTGFNPALGVLVVACPCALVLATPTAVMAAMAWLARAGIVVKGSAALERFSQVDTVVFDKTGTLTLGQLSISSIECGGHDDEVLRIAAIAERASEHLLARAIVREAESRNQVIPLADDFQAYPGGGVVTQVRPTMLGNWIFENNIITDRDVNSAQPCAVVVGNRRLIESQNVFIPDDFPLALEELDELEVTPVFVAVNNVLVGILGVNDQPRPESSTVIAELKEQGVEHVAMLTGDLPSAAAWICEEVPAIDEVQSQLLPVDKAEWIKQREAAGHNVAMIGDGINDAPALAISTVGIAIGNVGNDIAAEAGDLVLMGNSLSALPSLRRLSRELVANIQQSIFLFAFGMNAIGMLLCAIGLLSPVGGAIFHEASSLAVMLNAMRLLWFERYDQTRLGKQTAGLVQFSEWITEALSPSRIVFTVIRLRFLLVRLAVSIAVLAWLCSSIVIIKSDEQAFVTRFGKFEKNLEPGLHWRYPAPFEKVERMQAHRIQRVAIGFRVATSDQSSESQRTADSPQQAIPIIEWTSRHDANDFVNSDPAQATLGEKLILTGDEVPVELNAEVQFFVDDFYQYRYGSSQPAEIIQSTAEHLLRANAAKVSLNDILIDKRADIEKRCLQQLRNNIAAYRLGIQITDFVLLDIHPPQQVVSAYRDISDAWENRQQLINESEGYYVRKLLSAAGERAIDFLNASAEGIKAEQASESGWSRRPWELTDESWQKLTTNHDDATMLLSGDAAAALAVANRDRTQQVESAQGAAHRFSSLFNVFQKSTALTQTHLYWNTVAKSLRGKDLTVIDPRSSRSQQLILWENDVATQMKNAASSTGQPAFPNSLPGLSRSPQSTQQPDAAGNNVEANEDEAEP